MDTEKQLELEKKMFEGKSPNDEGPYYHHSFWEAYKGNIKGKLGGVVIGAIMGAVVGAAVTACLPLAGVALSGTLIGTVIAGFSAAGIVYGEREFSDIGTVSGAVAAAHDYSEIRMKSFESKQFGELKHEINELKAMVQERQQGSTAQSKTVSYTSASSSKASSPASKVNEDISTIDITEKPYRTTHYAKLDPAEENKFVFKRVALIGLVVGVAAGAILASGGLASGILDGLVAAGGPLAPLGIMAASMVSFGAIGASFGVNRDIFRKIFDTTDLWLSGIISSGKVRQHQIETGKNLERESRSPSASQYANEPKEPPQVATFVSYPPPADRADSSPTYHRDRARSSYASTAYRDRIIADAEKALLGLDPNLPGH